MVTLRNLSYNYLSVECSQGGPNIQELHSTLYTRMPETKVLEHYDIISNTFPNDNLYYYRILQLTKYFYNTLMMKDGIKDLGL